MEGKQEMKKGITMGKAILKLQAFAENGMVTVHVLKARHLASAYTDEACHSYIEVSLQPDVQRGSYCRTSTKPDRHPIFNEKFSFELLMPEDAKRRLYVSVWNDPGHTVHQAPHIQPRLEFMGCMSFGVQHVRSLEKEINGWYYLLKEGIGARKHLQAILNSAIYSETGDIPRPSSYIPNQHPSNQHPALATAHPATAYHSVTEQCHRIIQDITENGGDTTGVAPPHSPDDEDTYTTFIFTKSPVPQRHSRDFNDYDEFRRHGVTFGTNQHVPATQCPPPEQQEESVYVKMYPPKSWQQNGVKHPPPPPLPAQKAAKRVGFSDLVNADNIRGIPEGRMAKDKPLCQSSPKKLPDISEIDTQGYMSLCNVRRTPEENMYASIEPLNGSCVHENASEISEFTYSKTLSRASQTLYPHLKNTPLSSRKLLHLQQQELQRKQREKLQQQQLQEQLHKRQLFQQQQQQHTHHVQHRSRSVSPDRKPNPRPQDQIPSQKPKSPERKPKFGCQDRIPECTNSSQIHPDFNRKLIIEPETRLRSQSTDALMINKDVSWPENNMHNDSGIGDHDSSPKSDGELSDRGVKFDYKPAPFYTPTLQRANKKPMGGDVIKVTDIQVHDVPRWVREDKSRIVCANDSCVEDNDTGGVHVAHTPSCPYHVCTSCNGIVPEHAMQCSDPSQQCTADHALHGASPAVNGAKHTLPQGNQVKQCGNHALHNGNQGQPCRNNQQTYQTKTQLPHSNQMHNLNHIHASYNVPNSQYPHNASQPGQPHFHGNGNQMTSQTPLTYSDDGDCESEDDFGYMSMEKFNVYKETVMKHHRGQALTCRDHETATKIYFL